MALGRVADVMGMSDAVWRRHANPWSVWTRFTCMPLLVLAIWSWSWIGWWSALPILVALIWTYLNPRIFSEPKDFDSWGSLGVMGERIHIYRPKDVAAHHHRPVTWLTWAPLLGLVPLIWGLIILDLWMVVFGTALSMVLKMWFVDRMAWIAREWRDAGNDWDALDQS